MLIQSLLLCPPPFLHLSQLAGKHINYYYYYYYYYHYYHYCCFYCTDPIATTAVVTTIGKTVIILITNNGNTNMQIKCVKYNMKQTNRTLH